MEGAGGSGEPSRSAREQRQGAAIARQLARELRQSTTLFAQQEPRRATSGQNSPSTPPLTACPGQNSPSKSHTAPLPVQNSPSTPEMAQFGAIYACRESFVPFSPPRSQAGRILHRTRGRDGASQHNRTPGPTCVEGAGGTGVEGTGGTSVEGTGGTGGHGRASRHRAWPRCQWITGPGRSSHKQQQRPAQTNFACNSPTTRIDTRSKTAEYQRSDFNS